MPRRPPVIEPDIALYRIPHSARRGVPRHGRELERNTVSRTRCHFSTVSNRTRPVKRELKGKPTSRDAPEPRKRGKRGSRE